MRNLADPDFEPTDDDFRDLLHAAGTDAREAHAAAEAGVRERIRALRAAAEAPSPARDTSDA